MGSDSCLHPDYSRTASSRDWCEGSGGLRAAGQPRRGDLPLGRVRGWLCIGDCVLCLVERDVVASRWLGHMCISGMGGVMHRKTKFGLGCGGPQRWRIGVRISKTYSAQSNCVSAMMAVGGVKTHGSQCASKALIRSAWSEGISDVASN